MRATVDTVKDVIRLEVDDMGDNDGPYADDGLNVNVCDDADIAVQRDGALAHLQLNGLMTRHAPLRLRHVGPVAVWLPDGHMVRIHVARNNALAVHAPAHVEVEIFDTETAPPSTGLLLSMLSRSVITCDTGVDGSRYRLAMCPGLTLELLGDGSFAGFEYVGPLGVPIDTNMIGQNVYLADGRPVPFSFPTESHLRLHVPSDVAVELFDSAA